jgi:thiamine transport system substrate-binding protein
MKKKICNLIVLISLILLIGCTKSGPTQLNVMTHDSFAVSEFVIKEFEQANEVKVNIIMSGDAGSALNQAILTKASPIADVFYGFDNTFLSRALGADIFEIYSSPILKEIPDQFQLDKSWRALPVDYGDVCINYDKAYFAEKKLAIPQTLEDLLKPEYRGLLVVENPAVSSPGLAFLLATIAKYGSEGYLNYWQQLRANNLVVVNDWNTAYYTNFSGSSGKGLQPMVVSYNTSPAAEVIFASEKLSEAPTATLVGLDMCFRQIEFVGILKGTQSLAIAQKFIDFMLSRIFQEDLPLKMFVYPTNANAILPVEFVKFVQMPEKSAFIAPEKIAANLDTWIMQWRNIVLE